MGKTVINIENVNIIEGLELCCRPDAEGAMDDEGMPGSVEVELCRIGPNLYDKLKEMLDADGPEADAGEEGIADRLAKEYGIDGKTAGAIAAAVDLIRKDLLEEG